MKHISIISAVAKNGAIGFKNRLLYRLPDDLKFFKKITTGSVVVMGGNTYKSLPNGPLPNRINVVVSTSIENDGYDNLIVFNNSDEMLNFIENTKYDVYIIGGASMYNMFIDIADELYLTEIDAEPADYDTLFPFFNREDYQVEILEEHKADEKHEVPFNFVHYKKKN